MDRQELLERIEQAAKEGWTELKLFNKKITELPPEIGQLQNLTQLDLSSNQLSALPPEITQLQNLTRLYLSGNQLSALPPEILQLPLEITWKEWHQLRDGEMTLRDNPLTDPPIEIVKQGREAVAAYFAALEKEAKKPLNEVKVLLVGDGGAGKTSLLKRLSGGKFEKYESQTHGINIKPFPITYKGREITLNYWDFGGQEVMHHTHQFFFSKRSAYILVLDGRKEEEPEYWLDYIQTLGGDSPVLVVLNKADQNPGFEVNRIDLQRKYPGIQGFFHLSCRSRKGIGEVRKALYAALDKVEMLNTVWPQSWFEVKQCLAALDKPFIDYDEYTALCVKHGVTDETAQDTLVEYLDQLGTVVHFSQLELRDVHVLKPKWITEAVYRLITHPRLVDDKGVLPLKNLGEMLKPARKGEYEYPRDKHRYIVELMKEFELCYPLKKDRLLVPDLLPIAESKFSFDEDNALRFVFQYRFLPRSVMPRFIVKRHQDIDKGLQWRSGVVLRDKAYDARAVVRADKKNKRIEVFVNGGQRRDYFAVVRKTLWEIHASFEVDKLGIAELIPLPGENEHTVSYAHLIGLEQLGEQVYVDGVLRKRFSVAEMLNGIESASMKEERQERLKREGINLEINIKDSKNVAVAAGEKSSVEQHNLKTVAPAMSLEEIRAEFAELKKVLTGLEVADKKKLERALDDAEEELNKPDPDKSEVAEAVGRALKVANKTGDLLKTLKDKIVPIGENIGAWCGEHGGKVVKFLGGLVG